MKLLIIIAFLSQLLYSAPAFQGKRTFTQPDGTVVEYRAQGDEHLNWMESENGDILLYSKKNKRLEFAEIKNSTLQASGVAFSKKASSERTQISKEELSALHKERRDERLSKMKSRHPAH